MSTISPQAIAQTIRFENQVINWSIFLIVVAVVVTTARFIARWKGRMDRKNLTWIACDDILILIGFFSVLVTGITWITGAHANISGYAPNLTPTRSHDLALAAAKSGWIGSVTYIAGCAFPKLSLCALYLRIFTAPRTRFLTWCVVVFLVANFIAFFIVQVMYCNPPSYYWTTHAFQNQAITPPGGNRCINFVAVAIAVNPPHIVSDIVMLGLPLPMIWGLQVSRSRRVGLAVAFGLAGVGLVGCVVRWVSYLVEMNDTSMRVSTIQTILTLLEPTMYLTAACLPPTRSLFVHVVAAMRSSSAMRMLSAWTTPRRRRGGSGGEAPQLPMVTQHVDANHSKMEPGGGGMTGRAITVSQVRDVRE